MEIVFELLYNPETNESCAKTVSIHKTREGCELALELHKQQIKKEFDEMWLDYEDKPEFEWDSCQWWGIRETELKQ